MQSTMLIVEMAVDAQQYGGFVPLLYDVLTELGVPTEPIRYVCRGEAGPDGQLQGHIVINLTVPASTTLPGVAAFQELAIETSVANCVQAATRQALRHVVQDTWEHIQGGRFRLLPRVLDLTYVEGATVRVLAADQLAQEETDPCLQFSGRYILAQDRYITAVETENKRYRDLVFTADHVIEMEQVKKKILRDAILTERHSRDRLEDFSRAREVAFRQEIQEWQNKARDYELRGDHLDAKVLELEDRLERQRVLLGEFRQREKEKIFSKLCLETRYERMSQENEMLRAESTHNTRHLAELIKTTEYFRDKAQRTRQAWIASDNKRVKEIARVQEPLPPKMRKEARKHSFRPAPTTLNLTACPSEHYPEVPRTIQLEAAEEYASRLHRTDAELEAMDRDSEEQLPSSRPTTPPYVPTQ